MPRISVIIPTFNRSKYLDFTLSAFTIQTFSDFELLVVDDGSLDDTKDIIDRYSSKLKIRYLYQNHQGLSAARNSALDICNSRFVVHIDSDRIPSPTFLEEHFNILNQYHNMVSIGLKPLVLTIFNHELNLDYRILIDLIRKNPEQINNILHANEVKFIDSEQLQSHFDNIMRRIFIKLPRDNYQDVIEEYSDHLTNFNMGWAIATGGNFAYDFEQASDLRFDLNFKGWGLEDTDFTYQLYVHGFNFFFNRNAVNYHQIHPRKASETQELWDNFEYFVGKFNTPEIRLFRQVFMNKVTLSDANKILNCLSEAPLQLKDDFNNLLKKY